MYYCTVFFCFCFCPKCHVCLCPGSTQCYESLSAFQCWLLSLKPLVPAGLVLSFNRFHDLIGGIHVPVDDGVDKLNRKYTLLVFLFLALPIFTKQYIGDPIECFTPTYFTEPQARYVNSYCWTASTYYLVAADADDDDYEGFTGQVNPLITNIFSIC